MLLVVFLLLPITAQWTAFSWNINKESRCLNSGKSYKEWWIESFLLVLALLLLWGPPRPHNDATSMLKQPGINGIVIKNVKNNNMLSNLPCLLNTELGYLGFVLFICQERLFWGFLLKIDGGTAGKVFAAEMWKLADRGK